MEDVRRLLMSADLVINRGASSKPAEAFFHHLDNFRGYWGVYAISDRSLDLITAGWKQSSEDRYERAWQSFKNFLRSSSILFHQASLRNVLDYLTHLYDRKLSLSTIDIHRSAISMTMAPIGSVRVGDHPLVKRLMSGVFNERPTRRAAPALWDPLKVLSVFQHWPVNLPLSSLMRKGAFLMAIATAERPSELVALLCDDNHFWWEGENIRFVPSRLTKTDRPGHLAPPFHVKPWKADL
jgi:integrase